MGKEDAARYFHIDESRMLDKVLSIPDQIEETWSGVGDFDLSRPDKESPLVICGMGGSAIGGLLLRDLISEDSPVALHIESGYTLPSFAGRDTTVVCVSYSGNTEEVLSTFRNALLVGCPLAVVTSGGSLESEAERAGIPVCRVPGGIPPRAAIGHLLTSLLRIASNCGLCQVDDDEIGKAVHKARKLARKYSLEAEASENKALQLAKRLYGKIPLIYSGSGLLAGMSYRWKCQFNENSKSMAFSNVFPELGHNEVMGWECPEKLREDLFLIMLRDCEDHHRVQKRMDVTYSILESLAGGAVMIDSEGGQGREGRLARLLSVLLLGDFASVYLAVEYGKDPTPIEKIEKIKQDLRLEGQ